MGKWIYIEQRCNCSKDDALITKAAGIFAAVAMISLPWGLFFFNII